jgi:two-component system chemotaxis response regulator CheB
MIIDDSLVARTALRRMVEAADDLEVLAAVSTAEQALEVLRGERVDVILLDLDMPGMGGLEALPKLIERARGARILVVSALTLAGAEHTLAALSLGATDTLPKPQGRGFHGVYREVLLGKIRDLGRVLTDSPEAARPQPSPVLAARGFSRTPPGVLAIGASTGGVHALANLFAGLPPKLGIPILVTQHLPPAFMPHFARQLTSASGCETVLAEEGTPVEPGRILIAPGDAHLTVGKQAGRLIVRLDRSPSASGCMPSVDPMFASLADEIGDRTLGVVLTGMGRDGAQGAARVVAAGGSILAQDEASSAVWGMPRAVIEAGLAAAVLPPHELAELIGSRLGLAACR